MIRIPLIIGTLPVTLQNGTTADATQVMSDLNWIVNQVNANAVSLSNAALVNANNNFSVVQSGQAATQPANFPIASQVQGAVFNTLTSTLGTNTITSRCATLALSAYPTGGVFNFVPSQTNTGPVTFAVDTAPAVAIRSNNQPLVGHELRQGAPVEIQFDGAAFNLIGSPAAQIQDGGLTTLTSALGSNQITARSLVLPLASYVSGQVFTFIPWRTNNGSVTINIDSLGAKNVLFNLSSGIGGELTLGIPAAISYDGAQFNHIGPVQPATKLLEQGAVSTTTYASPARQHFHPSAAKAWFEADTNGNALAAYNISSITDNGVGVLTANWLNSFSSANYSMTASAISTYAASAATSLYCMLDSPAAGSMIVNIVRASDGNRADPATATCGAAFGTLV